MADLKLIVNHEYYLSFNALNNCNLLYISGLATYGDTRRCLIDILSSSVKAGPVFGAIDKTNNKTIRSFRNPECGAYLFAQGSSHTDNPYGPKLKALIEKEGLGTVIESPPISNPFHNNRPGRLYIWIVNRYAMQHWFDENIKGKDI